MYCMLIMIIHKKALQYEPGSVASLLPLSEIMINRPNDQQTNQPTDGHEGV